MNKEKINEKELAQKLKAKLNSPEYINIPQILEYSDRYGDMLAFIFGRALGESVHSEKENNFIVDMSRERGDKMFYEYQLEPAD